MLKTRRLYNSYHLFKTTYGSLLIPCLHFTNLLYKCQLVYLLVAFWAKQSLFFCALSNPFLPYMEANWGNAHCQDNKSCYVLCALMTCARSTWASMWRKFCLASLKKAHPAMDENYMKSYTIRVRSQQMPIYIYTLWYACCIKYYSNN